MTSARELRYCPVLTHIPCTSKIHWCMYGARSLCMSAQMSSDSSGLMPCQAGDEHLKAKQRASSVGTLIRSCCKRSHVDHKNDEGAIDTIIIKSFSFKRHRSQDNLWCPHSIKKLRRRACDFHRASDCRSYYWVRSTSSKGPSTSENFGTSPLHFSLVSKKRKKNTSSKDHVKLSIRRSSFLPWIAVTLEQVSYHTYARTYPHTRAPV